MASSTSSEERDNGVLAAFLSQPDSPTCFRFFSRSGNNAGVYVLGGWATCIAVEYIKSEAIVKNWSDTTSPSPRSSTGSTGSCSSSSSSSSSSTVPVIVLNDTICKEVIADCLLRRGASVEFYDKNSRGEYECVQRGSPGNITDFEATLFEQEHESEIQLMARGALVFDSAPVDGRIHVGLAALNTTLRHISVTEYKDVVQLVDLDVLLAQLNVKELSLNLTNSTAKKGTDAAAVEENTDSIMKEPVQAVRRICDRLRIHLSIQNGLKEMQGPVLPADVALKDLLRVPEERMLLTDFPLGSKACALLLHAVDLLDSNNHRAFYLRHVMPSTFMKLDSAALEALHIFSERPDTKGMAPTSVYSWLSRGVTTGMGARVMRQWLLQPLRHTADIIQRQSMVQLLLDNTPLRDALVGEVLRKCGGDMDRLNRKLMRRRVTLKDLKKVLEFVDVLPACVRVLRLASNTEGHRFSKLVVDEYTAPLEEIVEHVSNLRTLVESSVDFTSDPVAPRINPAFDDDLEEVHENIVVIQQAMEKEYQLLVQRYNWAEKGKIKLEYHNTYGYVFRLPGKENKELRAAKDLIIISTAKDGVRFVSDNLTALSTQYKSISQEYDRRQETLKQKLIDTVASYLPLLDDAKEILASLDVFVAWARLVKESPNTMVCPTVYDPPGNTETPSVSQVSSIGIKKEGSASSSVPSQVLSSSSSSSLSAGGNHPLLHFHELRHPLVELRQSTFHSNSIHLSTEHNGIVITGPNMGGKSTFMRSVGVAVVLAQIGCFVPAEAAELTVRDAVMCRVGATDHLSQGVSTFMVEMLESSAILSQASPQTLAIVDELGRGTSTYDGFGLAWAIAKTIGCDIGATLLFSTHFHEMTELPYKYSALQNFHFGAAVNEEAGTLQFLYQLEPGPCGQSYGLYVAALARMPEEVIESAKRKASALESFEKNDLRQQGNQPVVEVVAENKELAERVQSYAARVRHATQAGDEAELSRLHEEISQDAFLCRLLSAA